MSSQAELFHVEVEAVSGRVEPGPGLRRAIPSISANVASRRVQGRSAPNKANLMTAGMHHGDAESTELNLKTLTERSYG